MAFPSFKLSKRSHKYFLWKAIHKYNAQPIQPYEPFNGVNPYAPGETFLAVPMKPLPDGTPPVTIGPEVIINIKRENHLQ